MTEGPSGLLHHGGDLSASSTSIDGPWTIRRVLEWTTGYLKERGSESPRLDAELLLAHARGCPRIQLYTAYDEPLPDAVRATMRELVQRRAAAEPVAYLIGQREFFSLPFHVTPAVLIPRPDTETLVMEALNVLKPRATPTVLDLGTGSGCIAIALAVNFPTARTTAVDLSNAALEVARRNAARHTVTDRIQFLEGDLFDPLPAGARFDAIVSNPPYVRTGEIPELQAEVRLSEPHGALDGGEDGLDIIRRIVDNAPSRLVPGGALLIECSPEQAAAVRGLLEQQGDFTSVGIRQDLSSQPRVVMARRSA